MEKLYGEIGKKIKLAAYVTFIVEAVIAVLEGLAVPIILFTTVDDSILMFLLGILLGALAAALGILVAWVSSWLLYGFGELIDKSCDIEKNTSDIRRNIIGIKNDTCDIEKNTRNGQSKMQIDEDISEAETKAAKIMAEKKAAQTKVSVEVAKIKAEKEAARAAAVAKIAESTTEKAEITAKDIMSSITIENSQELSDFTGNVSAKFIREIVAADESESDWESRYYLKTALKYLKDPAELHIIGLLFEMSEEELKASLKEIRTKCGR